MMLKRHDRKQIYMLPGSGLLICKDALCKILGMGHDKWSSCVLIAKLNLPPTHGLKGRASNRRNFELETLLSEFFDKQLELTLPRATMIVRDMVRGEVQVELRGDDDEIRELPSHFTKKGMFNQMVAELGWKYQYDAKGRIVKRLAIEGLEQHEQVPSWFMFFQYWKAHYPKLVVAAAREDVCNQCFVYANQHKYFSSRNNKCQEDNSDIIEEEVLDDEDIPPMDDDEEDEDGLLKKMLDSETLIKKAGRHVEMAQLQRAICTNGRREKRSTAYKRDPPTEYCAMLPTMRRTCTYPTSQVNNLGQPTTTPH
jgi:hypothetical protein